MTFHIDFSEGGNIFRFHVQLLDNKFIKLDVQASTKP